MIVARSNCGVAGAKKFNYDVIIEHHASSFLSFMRMYDVVWCMIKSSTKPGQIHPLGIVDLIDHIQDQSHFTSR